MSEATWAGLRALLIDRYGEFKHRIARRLGSTDLAADTLQETWLRLNRPGSPGAVERPDAYLFRIALNIASNRRSEDRRRLALSEIAALRDVDRDELDPERIVESRAEIVALTEALDELPPRCRAIFIAARLDEVPHKVLAERFGVSTRMVERDLERALDHCGQRLETFSRKRFGMPPSKRSKE